MPDTDFIMKCRGLPWSCTEDDLREFFGEAARSITQIKLTKDRDGRASGEGFVVFSNREDYDFALTKDKKYIGKRYVELQQVSSMESDCDDGDKRYGESVTDPNLPGRETSIVRLGGLPYGCTKEEIMRFFEPLEIADKGIVMTYDRYSGKPKGEAFVAFNDDDSASKALAKNKEYIQHRYVDIYPSSYGEMLRTLDGGFDPYYGSGRGWERDRRPRGLPYDRPGSDRGYRDSRMHRNEKGGFACESQGGFYNGWLGTDELISGLSDLIILGLAGNFGHVWDRCDLGKYGGGSDGYDDGYGGGRGGGGPMRRGWRDEPPMGGHRGYSPPRRRYTTPPPEYCIRMRGLPYRATERDIIDFFWIDILDWGLICDDFIILSNFIEFFQPLRPASIDVLYEYGTDRPSGEAIVEFRNRADFDAAMQRNRNYMGMITLRRAHPGTLKSIMEEAMNFQKFDLRIKLSISGIFELYKWNIVQGRNFGETEKRKRRKIYSQTNKIGDVNAGDYDLNVDTLLHDWNSTYLSYRTSSIFITTFNVNGRIPKLDGISGWLSCEGIFPPDFYIIGLQEMDLSPQAFIMNTSTRHMEWKVIIAKSFPEGTNYDLIGEVRLVGILLAVYRRIGSKIKVRPSEIDAVLVPSGRCNVLGTPLSNKGGVAISIYMNDTAVCFVNAHFAAHLEANEKRIMDYEHIVKSIYFRRNGKALFEHDAIFWFGDLNFRLDTAYGMSNNELRELCNDNEAFRDMIIYDQKDVHIRQKFYDSIPSIKFSDHRPVRALFYLGVQEIDFIEYDKTYRRAFREANRRNDYRNTEEEKKVKL
ncbi:unnamed protein product [Acanthocheilonema viteae]|uniref:RRM domain-containing protein n=1 Tax=Acanthocheilonema viteae TaxID=6277 RepID=A0A498S8R7_ACAVI|nr:unnamed protein product [Acanthocheilonema viteae]